MPWAKLKLGPRGDIMDWHSLIDHSADVAAVLIELIEQPTIKSRLAKAGNLGDLTPGARDRLGALAFIHDIGKANRGFQARQDPKAPLVGHINELHWLFHDHWGMAHQARLEKTLGLERLYGWCDGTPLDLFSAVFAHHGRPWRALRHGFFKGWDVIGGDDPVAGLGPLRAAMDRWFPLAFAPGPPLPGNPEFQHAFAGLLMLADWLGSDPQFFPMANGAGSDRLAFARENARAALAETGLNVETKRVAVKQQPSTFSDLFGFPPHESQTGAAEPTCQCVVLEAETGSGKTEAALWRFQDLFRAGAVDGLYFALPTRVAASQIFERVKAFCNRMFPPGDRPMVVLAVPGQITADDARGHRLPDFSFDWDDAPDEALRRRRWAAEGPKRFLAAQIAVGTIDQALLGAISTRHAHLRGSALLRHLLVVDEVHASDRYMEKLLAGLLKHHLQAGGHALLLSATLGEGARARLLGVTPAPFAQALARPYPAASWAASGTLETMALRGRGVAKAVAMAALPMMDDPAAIAALALAAAAGGAKILIIRNTVAAAIATLQALETAAPGDAPLFRVQGVATLHHSRFAPADRRRLDGQVQASLGKTAPAGACIVVGTQTLEISLDLDADLLITDLCPVDVLLQRIGRLHRHDKPRLFGFAQPRCQVLTPAARDLFLLLGRGGGRHGLGQVYEDARVIEATWRLVETATSWRIPDMNRELVEAATHDEKLNAIDAEFTAAQPDWQKTLHTHLGNTYAEAGAAEAALLKRDRPFSAFEIPEDDVWATRLGGKDITVTLPNLPGPFGGTVETLNIPYFFGASAEDELADITQGADWFTFRLGSADLRYDRYGLRRMVSSS
jgi:CRISPR-associated endonuclease/helicase Cas3